MTIVDPTSGVTTPPPSTQSAEIARLPSTEERDLIERMRDDAAANGDHQGAADLDALLSHRETR